MNISDSELEDIYGKLYAFTHYILKQHRWFRKGVKDTYLKGKSVDDYVREAITRYLEHPERYDCAKRSLIGYLKNHIIKSLVGNDARSKENELSVDISVGITGENQDESFHYSEQWLPHVETLFDEEIDYKTVISEIRKEVHHDTEAAAIFEAICLGQQTRREVIKEQGWTSDIFDNAMKRLKRILTRVAKEYRLIK